MAADRRLFPSAVVTVTTAGFVVPALAAPGRGLAWLLFLGSSVHVAATFALFSFADVRRHSRQNPTRYVVVPLTLITAAGITAATVPVHWLTTALLGFLGWQLWHYQQQNLGLAALTARTTGQPPLTTTERRCLRASAVAGILAMAAHPTVTQLVDLQPPARLATGARITAALLVTAAVITTARRRHTGATAVVLLLGVAFPLPLLLTTSPYAALGGMTLAHGLQYLLLVGLVFAGPAGSRRPSPTTSLFLLTGVLALAGALAAASHLHHGPATTRLVFGGYLGIVMTHFVVDAGLWRLRDAFPRQWLGQRLPALLTPRLTMHRAPV